MSDYIIPILVSSIYLDFHQYKLYICCLFGVKVLCEQVEVCNKNGLIAQQGIFLFLLPSFPSLRINYHV